jgi:hypothetical protein
MLMLKSQLKGSKIGVNWTSSDNNWVFRVKNEIVHFQLTLHRFEVAGLLSLVGARLTKLHLMFEGRGQAANDAQAANNDSQV